MTDSFSSQNDVPEKGERIREILALGLAQNASDVILTAYTPPVYKIYGACVKDNEYGILDAEAVNSILEEMLTHDQLNTLRKNRQIDFSAEYENYRWRVNIASQRGSYWATMRTIPTRIKTAADLGLPKAIVDCCRRQRGLILVTGPTGSGKSTTLAALIDHINRNSDKHIVTIEDPIEFIHENQRSVVNQREVGSDVDSFKTALKSVLRQAPDVILVGEMRDQETMEAAITAAETGHLVMGTLHTNSAAGTIDRIVDSFPDSGKDQVRTQLASSLVAVMSQTLVSKKDGTGRAMAYELMLEHSAIAAAIREGATFKIADTMQTNIKEGMTTLDRHLYKLQREGVITQAIALDLALDRKDLQRMIADNKDIA